MRIFNVGFIFLFMAMLMLPLLFVDLSSNRVSVEENRMLAERPGLSELKNQPGTFVRNFDAWFKDSTGFRKQLIQLYQMIDKNKWLNAVVRYTVGEDVVMLIGEKGHHYSGGPNGIWISRYQGKRLISDEQLANTANKLEEVKIYLDSKRIPLLIMLCTDKEMIYPEFYPKSIKRRPEPIEMDLITAYLKEHTNIDVFNIRQALLAEKDNYLLYDVSSGDLYHYNEIGAFFAYRELMKHVNIYFPWIVPYELNDIDISYDEKGIPDVSLKAETAYKRLDTSFFDDVELNRPFIWQNVAYENIDPNLPLILFFRDSYAGYFDELHDKKFIMQYIASHFGKAIFIHYQNLEHFEEYIAKYKPDIVVFETREPHNFAFFAARIPELP